MRDSQHVLVRWSVAGALVALLSALWIFRVAGDPGTVHPSRGPRDDTHARVDENEKAPLRTTAPLQTQSGAGEAATERTVLPTANARIAGRVLGDGRAPVAGATVQLALLDGTVVNESTPVGEGGRFSWEGLAQRLYRVTASARGAECSQVVMAPDPAVECVLAIGEGEGAVALRVQVLDRDGRPVAGAEVTATGEFTPCGTRTGETDENGLCVFAGTPCPLATISARTGDGRAGFEMQAPGQRPVVQVVVAPAGILHGVVRTSGSLALPEGAMVVALLGSASSWLRGHAGRFQAPIVSSSYRFDALPAGVYALSLIGAEDTGAYVCGRDVEGGIAYEVTDEGVDPLTAIVKNDAATQCDLHIAIGGVVEGFVRDAAGAPLGGAKVSCERLLSSGRVWNEGQICGSPVEAAEPEAGDRHPAYERSVQSSADGRYRISGILPGQYRLVAERPGHVRLRENVVRLVAGVPVRHDFTLPVAGAVEGVVGHAAIVVLWSEEPRVVWAREADSAGLFHFPDVAPGRYLIGVLERDELARQQMTLLEPPTALARLTVEERTAAYVDLRADLPVVVAGRLVGGRGPIADAVLALAGATTTTDAQGEFEFRFANRIEGEERILITKNEVTSGVMLPNAARGASSWRGELQVTLVPTRLFALAADGVPVDANVELSGHALGSLRIAAASGSKLVDIPLAGVHARVEFADGSILEQAVESGGVVEFVAPPAGELRVLVTDAEGRPMAKRPVRAVTWIGDAGPADGWKPYDDESRVAASEGLTDATGRATLRGVRAGEVLVHLKHVFGPVGPSPVARVQLPAGQTLEIHLEQK